MAESSSNCRLQRLVARASPSILSNASSVFMPDARKCNDLTTVSGQGSNESIPAWTGARAYKLVSRQLISVLNDSCEQFIMAAMLKSTLIRSVRSRRNSRIWSDSSSTLPWALCSAPCRYGRKRLRSARASDARVAGLLSRQPQPSRHTLRADAIQTRDGTDVG
jgi:hypothetical protein